MSIKDGGTTTAATHITPLAIQQEYWDGLIPIQLSLAPTSVVSSCSPTTGGTLLPRPVHVLVSRTTFLHVALESAVRRFHPFAPDIFLSRMSIQEPDAGVAAEDRHERRLADRPGSDDDDDTATAGTRTTKAPADSPPKYSPLPPYPVCWFEDEETKLPLRWHFFVGVLFDLLHPETESRQRKRRMSSSSSSSSLPWKIRLHLTNYPTSQLLPLEEENVLGSVQFSFRNAWKQALTILTGSSRCAMQMTKESHGLVWKAIATGDCGLYHRVDVTTATTTGSEAGGIPIRLLVGRTDPPIQKRVTCADDATGRSMTLGELLTAWCPTEFHASPSSYICTVCGIEQTCALDDVTLDELYKHCYSPDRFLYILLVEE
jgi:hypothetical protein